MKDCFREACRTGAEIYSSVFVIGYFNIRVVFGLLRFKTVIALGKCRAIASDKKERLYIRYLIADRLNTTDKFRSENKRIGFGKIEAVFDLIRSIAKIQRNRNGTGLKNPEIYREPFKTVHKQDSDMTALADTAAQQKISHSVGAVVKFLPGYFPAVSIGTERLDKFIFMPGHLALFLFGGVQLDKRGLVSV